MGNTIGVCQNCGEDSPFKQLDEERKQKVVKRNNKNQIITHNKSKGVAAMALELAMSDIRNKFGMPTAGSTSQDTSTDYHPRYTETEVPDSSNQMLYDILKSNTGKQMSTEQMAESPASKKSFKRKNIEIQIDDTAIQNRRGTIQPKVLNSQQLNSASNRQSHRMQLSTPKDGTKPRKSVRKPKNANVFQFGGTGQRGRRESLMSNDTQILKVEGTNSEYDMQSVASSNTQFMHGGFGQDNGDTESDTSFRRFEGNSQSFMSGRSNGTSIRRASVRHSTQGLQHRMPQVLMTPQSNGQVRRMGFDNMTDGGSTILLEGEEDWGEEDDSNNTDIVLLRDDDSLEFEDFVQEVGRKKKRSNSIDQIKQTYAQAIIKQTQMIGHYQRERQMTGVKMTNIYKKPDMGGMFLFPTTPQDQNIDQSMLQSEFNRVDYNDSESDFDIFKKPSVNGEGRNEREEESFTDEF